MAAEKHKHHHLVDESLIASWDESIHINRGKEAESDEIQEIVRHHRKDDEQKKEQPPLKEEAEKIQKREAG